MPQEISLILDNDNVILWEDVYMWPPALNPLKES